jgi:phosphatidylglycerol:prolipoprotein diacylglycerol transferase
MHPTLFELGGKAFPSYGVLVTTGYVLAFGVILWLSAKRGLPRAEMAAYLLFLALATAIGAKLYFFIGAALGDIPGYSRQPAELWRNLKGGGAFYGGFIAGLLFSLWYLRRFKLAFWKAADCVAPGAALGHAVGRVGCFLAGCCYGRPTSLPWGVRFPLLERPVHPTQLYEAGLNLLNALVLFGLFRRGRRDGSVFLVYLFNYSLIRFLLEYFRGDPARAYLFRGTSPWTSLSGPQLVSMAGLAASAVLFVLRSRPSNPG